MQRIEQVLRPLKTKQTSNPNQRLQVLFAELVNADQEICKHQAKVFAEVTINLIRF
jgi:hypothetical protein